ncbi:MAG: YfiR family protein [Vicinamibacterales bacterium]
MIYFGRNSLGMAGTESALARRRRAAGGRWSCVGGAIAGLLLSATGARAQEVTEPSLKAAVLFNVARFAEWRPEALPAGMPLTACVLNDAPVTDALERYVKGRQVSGRGVNVIRVTADGPLRSCHVLYISGITAAQLAVVVKAVAGAPVLTISDFDAFARKGGVVHMYVENGKINFNVDLGLARRSGLQLSSRMLTLAAHVYETAAGAQ